MRISATIFMPLFMAAALLLCSLLLAGCSNDDDNSDGLADSLTFIEENVSQIRGLSTTKQSSYRLVSAGELEEELSASFEDLELLESEFIYKRLGILEPSEDLSEILSDLYGSRVAGLYEPETQELLVLRSEDGELDLSTASTYAHEYVHFLQDVAFDLEQFTYREGDATSVTSDATLARIALVEGDATLVTALYVTEHIGRYPETQASFSEPFEGNRFIFDELLFPYVQGTAFVDDLWLEAGGEFDLVNSAYERPPQSSEHILHSDKFVGDGYDAPIDVVDFHPTRPDSWDVTYSDVSGEFFIQNWLSFLGASSSNAALASSGWGGDAISVLAAPNGDMALLWVIVWDDAESDAMEFGNTLEDTLDDAQAFSQSDCGVHGTAWDSASGVLAHSTFWSSQYGTVSLVVAADSCESLQELFP